MMRRWLPVAGTHAKPAFHGGPGPHVVFAGGGTGGHLFPAVAVAERLASYLPGVRVTFAGSGQELERQYVHAAGHGYLALPSRPLPQKAWQTMRFVADNLAGFWAARWFLRAQEVSLVVGTGGYASAPMVRAAIAHRLPTVLLEQNVVPGKVTRWLTPSASVVCTSFEETYQYLRPATHVQFTGNPIRRSFLENHSGNSRLAGEKQRKQLLILGGSGGARSLNESIPRALHKLGEAAKDWQVVHQTGAGQLQATQALYQELGVPAIVVSFIDNLPDVLREADLVISRAGGTTLAELACAGVPAILIPYPEAADQHQLENAKVLATAGACRLIEQHDGASLLDDRLVSILQPLLQDAAARVRLAENLRAFARPHAADEVCRLVRELLQPLHLRAAA